MESKIRACFPPKAISKHIFHKVCHPQIHIVDWKNFDKGIGRGVEIGGKKPEEIGSVCLFNNSEIEVLIDAFGENALPIKKGHQAEQCECIIAPALYSSDNWILAVETKYAKDYDAAFKKNENNDAPGYPQKMVSQIISTVEYLRNNGVIDRNKMVYAIVSFPKLVVDFNSELFSWVQEEWSIENLIRNHKIRIKGCNSANIVSSKRIKLTD